MQLTALRYFHETAKTGSIRKAADALRVAPSAVSRQIMNLEHDLDAPLFERTNQGMRLTAAGELLARGTQKTFRDLERIRSSVDDLRELRRGHVTAHVIEALVAEFLPKIIAEFHDRYPQITFAIFTASTHRIIDALVRDQTDIGITFNAPVRPDIEPLAEYVEPLYCLVSLDHPLASLAQITPKDLLAYPLALPESSFGMRQMVDSALDNEKQCAKVFLNTDSLELAKNLAMTGRAVAFMPGLSVVEEVAQNKLLALRVQAEEFDSARTSICIHRNRDLPFAAREFAKFVGARLERRSAD